jgi:6-pyruvoyltetrahydropterin/6-carboxytetrahydropterin synthase
MTKVCAERYHDISCGHRVVGHEGKCQHLHGHNYRITFSCESESGTDDIGRVIDFGVIKSTLCEWLEKKWDHKMLLWAEDPLIAGVKYIDPLGVVAIPFNPTAENLGIYLLHLGPNILGPENEHIRLVKVKVEETRKCSAVVEIVPIMPKPETP